MDEGEEPTTPRQARLIAKEIEQHIGAGVFLAVVAFWVAHFFWDGPQLGWWWLAFFPVAIIGGTLIAGLPMIMLALAMGAKNTNYGPTQSIGLKAFGCIWMIASLPIGWFFSDFVASWMS